MWLWIVVIAIVLFLCIYNINVEKKMKEDPLFKEHVEELRSEKNEKTNTKRVEKQQETTNIMKCPKCQSDDIFVMGENKKSFSAKKAVAGAVLTGGIGAIAGFTGKKNGYDCFCGNCKHRFLLKDK